MNKLNFLILCIILYLILDLFRNKEKMMLVNCLPKINKKKYKEISELNMKKVNIHSTYSKNNNHIINDGTKIYQKMLTPVINNIVINGNRHNLADIEFHLGTTTFNYKKVGLEIHLLHKNVTCLGTVRIIIPLSLEDTKFKNGNNNEINIDLFNNLNEIPIYSCCQESYGKILNFDLTDFNKIINNKSFYQHKINKNTIWYYTKPYKYNRIFGKYIIKNLLK